MIDPYCVKCREKKTVSMDDDAVTLTASGSRITVKAVCPTCGSKMNRFTGGMEKTAEMLGWSCAQVEKRLLADKDK